MTTTADPLAGCCPTCRSDDLRRIGADGAQCRGCEAYLQFDHGRKAWARVLVLYGMAKPKRAKRPSRRRLPTWLTY